jgi:hypothetical protein
METTTRSTHRSSTRRFFIGASDVQGADEGTSDHDACCVQHWADPHNQPRKLNRHWYAAITGGMPLRGVHRGCLLLDDCNFAGLLPLEHSSNAAFTPGYGFPATRSDGSMLGRLSVRHGAPR